MDEQFNSSSLLSCFKTYLDRQKNEDPSNSYWRDDNVLLPTEEGIQIRCEGLHAFLARQDEIFKRFSEESLIDELNTLHRLIIQEKRGFTAPCYTLFADLSQKKVEPPEFVDTVTMCLRTISGLALILSSRNAFSLELKQKVSEVLSKGVDWLNASWSPGPPTVEGEYEGAGWGGFKRPGEISVYATWSVIAAMPAIVSVRDLLSSKQQKIAVIDLENYARKAGLWLRDYGMRQAGQWAAGEWDMADEDQIYNVYSLSTVAHFMQYFSHQEIAKALKAKENLEFLENLIHGILSSWEKDKAWFAETEKIDVGTKVDGKWQSLKYDDCSIVAVALSAISIICSEFGEVFSGLRRRTGIREGETLYATMEQTAKEMFEYLLEHEWDAERGVVTKLGEGSTGRQFCIYMTDRVVHALVAYERWQKRMGGGTLPDEVLLEEFRSLKNEVKELRQAFEMKLQKVRDNLGTAIEMVPEKVREKLEEMKKQSQKQED